MQLLRPTTATIRYVTGYSKAVVSLRTLRPIFLAVRKGGACVSLCRLTPPSSHHCRTFVTCPKVERSLFYLGANTPSDLVRIGQEAVAASSDIIADVRDRPQDGEVDGRDLIYTIDHISNTLCLVADPCELLRHVHPDDEWRAAANATVEEVSAFISRVNIDEKMYDIMTHAYAKYGANISKEESLVFSHMIESMRHQGVGLQSSAKTEYLALQSAESALSYELSDSSTLKHAAIPSIHGRPLPRNPAIYSYILRHSPEEQVRRMIWEAQTKCDPGTLSKLLRLHSIRSKISQIRGFRSFAQCAQRECILNEPEAVETFLRKCASSLKQKVSSELQELLDLKRSQGSADALLQPWDLDHLIGAERDKLGIQLRVSSVITYFERLLHDLFGISLVRDTSEPLWHPLVAKFRLVKSAGVDTDTSFNGSGRSDTNGESAAKNNHFGGKQVEVAHLYLDLFARDGKASVCAQFTVRCSKLLGYRNGAKKGTSHFPSAVSGLRMTHGYQYVTKECTDGSIRQLPATAVVCSFPTDPQHADVSSALNGTYIDAHSAQTLFHELGHTVHALCSRTDLQHLSGNRGGVDFAEFSSHLFELYFLDGIRDICKIEGLDYESAKKAELSFSKYSAIETGRMTLLALLDLKFYTFKGELTVAGIDDLYKSVDIFDEEFGSSKVLRLLGLPALSNFDHLIPYGGAYFCYLYSRVLAIKVWRSFEGFSRSRATGDRLYAFFEKGSTDASIAPLNELAGRDLAAMEDELFLA